MERRPLRRTSSNIELAVSLHAHPIDLVPLANNVSGDLQAEHIIPRSPSPVPLEERDPEDLSPEEARELIRTMRARSADKTKIKKEIKKEKREQATRVE